MIILIRHGQTVWNKLGKRQGQLNSPLTALGRIQAQRNGEKVAKFLKQHDIKQFKFCSSPLERAYSSAKIIAAELGVWPDTIKQDDRLKEINFGRWQGKHNDLVDLLHPEDRVQEKRYNWLHQIPQGESHALLQKRIKSWLIDVQEHSTVISVAHGVLNMAIRSEYLGLESDHAMSLQQSNSSVYVLKDGEEFLL